MRLPFSKILQLILIILMLSGCKKSYLLSEKQAILFQYEYINYAWGYQHTGFIVDTKGNILTFNNPDKWNFRDKDMILTEKQVAENITKCQSSGIIISQSELQKYSAYIKNIASSQVTASRNVAADAGTAEYICYQFSETSETYKGYIIKTEGDFTQENLNFYAKKIGTWMKDINHSLAKN
jgi:hypothetical protein